LIVAARHKVPAIGGRRHGQEVALVADEVAEALALQVVGDQRATVAAGDYGLAVGREGVGAMFEAIGWRALD
jgi:hypothetical protein